MANVAERWGLIPDLRSFCAEARPVWGTCAGMIFLADRATGASVNPGALCSRTPQGSPGTRAHATCHAASNTRSGP